VGARPTPNPSLSSFSACPIPQSPREGNQSWIGSSGCPGAGFTRQARGENPPDGAVIWFQLGKDFKGEACPRVLVVPEVLAVL